MIFETPFPYFPKSARQKCNFDFDRPPNSGMIWRRFVDASTDFGTLHMRAIHMHVCTICCPGKKKVFIVLLLQLDMQMSEQIKNEKVKNLWVGANIWAGLDTFISRSLNFSDYPMNL